MSVWCLTFFEREDMLMTNTRAVSMTTRIEVTKKLKQSYKTASKTEKGTSSTGSARSLACLGRQHSVT